MGKKVKTGKNRLDKFYRLAKEQGYRSRSAFKLIHLNKKYGFLENARALVDLCAAPGGWMQVAAKHMPPQSLIIGVDLVPIKPIPRCISMVGDITTDKTRSAIRAELRDWQCDVVLHDGAPNVGTDWRQDAFSQAELALHSLRLATSFLKKDGTFVTKLFRSRDYNSMLWVFNQLFGSVEATKPASSRNVSAEIFIVCRNYLAPARIDPKFLDPRHVFKEIDAQTAQQAGPASATEAAGAAINAIFAPETHARARRRVGYAEGDFLLSKPISSLDFINLDDPINRLGKNGAITFDPESDISKLEITTEEVRACCADLRVLGKKDFKMLLKWRLAVRLAIGLDAPETAPQEKNKTDTLDATGENNSGDEESRLLTELEEARKEAMAKIRRSKRKRREQQAKSRARLADGTMVAESDAELGEEFDFGKKHKKSELQSGDNESCPNDSDDEIENSEDEVEEISNPKKRAAKAIETPLSTRASMFFSADLFTGILRTEKKKDSTLDERYSQNEVSSEEKIGGTKKNLRRKLNENDTLEEMNAQLEKKNDKKSNARRRLAANAISSVSTDNSTGAAAGPGARDNNGENDEKDTDTEKDKNKSTNSVGVGDGDGDGDGDDLDTGGKEDLATRPLGLELAMSQGITSPTALTLAQRLLRNKDEIIDASFNRFSYGGGEDLPDWFKEEERKFQRPQLPITKEAMDEMRAKHRALDARPIKKVAEAKARKRKRAVARTERVMKKATSIAEGSDLSEMGKAKSIEKLLANKKRAGSKDERSKKPALVVARGSNKGLAGRPSGVKGRYKMVDSRMKKEVRALKRISKQTTGRKRKY